jgi:hypothetical protein
MNKSMQLLENWCSLNGWVCEQIPEEPKEGVRTPDYKLIFGGKVIYAEVKEIVASDEEKKVIINNYRLKTVVWKWRKRTLRLKSPKSFPLKSDLRGFNIPY